MQLATLPTSVYTRLSGSSRLPYLSVGSSGRNTAEQALVVDLAAPEERDRWYVLVRMVLNAGLGAGALLAGVLVAGGGTAGYSWIFGLNGLSFALAAALLVLVRVQRAARTTNAQSETYRTVLRNRPFLRLVGANTLLRISVNVLTVGLPPYLIVAVHAPIWIVGVLFAINTGMVVVLQLPVTRVVAPCRRTRSMAAGGLCWGCFLCSSRSTCSCHRRSSPSICVGA